MTERAPGWSNRFPFGPIVLPDGRELATLEDAATFITELPEEESALPEWQAAIEVLMLCSRSEDAYLALIGVSKALSSGKVREFKTGVKEHHWGRRKLKREE